MHTWSNNRRGDERIVERLDRNLVNHPWANIFPRAQCMNRVAIGSDHSPLELNLDQSDARGRKWFRFENMWLEREDCGDVIKAAWSRGGTARSLEDLESKMAECRRSLLAWSKQHFKHNLMEINSARRRLQQLYESVMNEEGQGEERALKSRIDALWKREEIYWKKRSRVKWLDHGDKNTKYFHQTSLARRRRNKIVRIRTV